MCAYKFPTDHIFSREDDDIARMVSGLMVETLRPLSLSEIHQHLKSKKIRKSESQVRSALQKYPFNFEIDDQVANVKLITKVNVCETHSKKKESCSGNIPLCSGLHFCKYFMLTGKCNFGDSCKFGHDLTTPHNMQVLRTHLLDEITVQDFMTFMKQSKNQNECAPLRLCWFYNSKGGCNPKIKKGKCSSLHICRHHIKNSCKFGKKCSRSHDVLSPSTKEILEKHGISTERQPKYILADLREVLTRDMDDDASSSEETDKLSEGFERMKTDVPLQGTSKGRLSSVSSTDESDGICFYYLRGKCLYGNGCRNFHSDLLYHWRYREKGTTDWVNIPLDEVLKIELSYCDPKNAEYPLKTNQGTICQIHFKTTANMNGIVDEEIEYEIQRLSTASSVEFDKQSLTTEWVWYWQVSKETWTKYSDDDMGFSSDKTSTDLEQAYVRNPEGQIEFQTSGHQYILDFNKMTQKNKHHKTEREVRRRPMFLDRKEIEERKLRKPGNRGDATKRKQTRSVGQDELEVAPPHWSRTDDLFNHCKIVPVDKKESPSTRKEYEEIEKLFCESWPNTVSIVSIERIENGELYYNYASNKKKLEKKKKEIVERRLFHGTKSSYVDAICKQGFDFRLNGQSTGALYGKGSYFATSAKYSHSYTDYSGDCTIFVVKVMVGEYALGKKEFVRPPAKDENNLCSELYDSCVNDLNNPSIFVIFDNSGQVYPEYLIKYEKKNC